MAASSRLGLVVAALILVAPPAVDAQQAGKVYRLGVLEIEGMASNAVNLGAFRQGLAALGYVEGQHFTIESRSADGRPERLSELAAELVRLDVDVIVTRGTPATLTAKLATRTIPIVMASSGDPVFDGSVASLARPGETSPGCTAWLRRSWAAADCSSSRRWCRGHPGSASSGIRTSIRR